MKAQCQNRQRNGTESGVVVILVSVLILVFFAFAALAIDIGYAASAAHQARSNAQLAALSALERYFFTDGDHDTRLAAALQRANEVSQLNMVVGGYTAREIELTESGDGRPVLRPGRFFYAVPEGGSNPCVDGEVAPCFVPYDASAPVNAFRIEGRYYNDITLRLASVAFGETRAPINIAATATIVPRHGCFVVDLSRSMTGDTHNGGNSQVYAYFRSADNPSATPPFDDTAWNTLLTTHPERGTEATDPTVHYADDYLLKAVISDSTFNPADHQDYHPAPTDVGGTYSAGVTEKNFMVDLFRDSTYSGPQPLTTVFAGIDRALQYLQTRAVVGDMACMIFYDQSLNWARVFKLTSDFDYLRSFTDVSVIDDPSKGLLKAIRHGLFPFPDAKTNMLMGLSEAMTQLSSTRITGVPSSDFIVLIGDGQTNCFRCSYDPRFDPNRDGVINYPDFFIFYPCYYPQARTWGSPYNNPASCPYAASKCTWADFDMNGVVDSKDYTQFVNAYYESAQCSTLQPCNNMYDNYYFSMQNVLTYVEEVVAPSKIPVHVMLVGTDSGPHTVDIENPDDPGSCLSEAEKRKRRNNLGDEDKFDTVRSALPYEPYCYSGWGYPSGAAYTYCYPEESYTQWAQKSDTQPFFEPNVDLYRIATMTGGIWAPIRPVLAAGESSCTPEACRPDLARRLTDPWCRTTDEQVDDYIDEILGQNPFTLVIPRTDY